MPTSNLRELIVYLVRSLQEQGGSPTRIRLHKLLYLADLEVYKRGRRALTGVDWIFHHYGPWSPQVQDALERGVPKLLESEAVYGQRKAYIYSVEADTRVDVEASSVRVLDRVVREWGLLDLNQLLDYVYFDTAPMRDATRGEQLDLSTVQAEQVIEHEEGAAPEALSAESLEALRKRAGAVRDKFRRAPRVKFRPPPFDQAYEDALDLMDQDEGRAIERRPISRLSTEEGFESGARSQSE